MNRTLTLFITGLCVVFFVSGCRTLGTGKGQTASVEGALSSLSSYQLKALDYENQGEQELALANWRIAENLVARKISALTDHMEDNAEKHYQKGLSLKKNGERAKSLKAFLTALRYDRGHKASLTQIRILNAPSRTMTYTVREGDSFESVAAQVYKNPGYEFIVRSFAGPDARGKLNVGQTLNLPILELEFTRRFFNFSKELNLARKLYKEKDYQGILPIAENILIHVPENEESVFLINSSYYGLAEKYFHDENYPAAIDMLKMIDPRFRNVKNRILYIERVQADRIREARENLSAAGYQKAVGFEKKKLYHKALSAYESVDPGYLDVKDRIGRLKKVMRQLADKHYLLGVRFFSDQKLEAAIAEWRETLNLDPSNSKARKDMENAAQLLKKINEIK